MMKYIISKTVNTYGWECYRKKLLFIIVIKHKYTGDLWQRTIRQSDFTDSSQIVAYLPQESFDVFCWNYYFWGWIPKRSLLRITEVVLMVYMIPPIDMS